MTDAERIADAKRWTENDYGLPPRVAKDLVALATALEAKLAEAERERDEAFQRAETAESVQASMTLAAEHAQDALAAAEADVRIYRKTAQDNIASRNAAESREKALLEAAGQAWIRRDNDSMITLGRVLFGARAVLAAGKETEHE